MQPIFIYSIIFTIISTGLIAILLQAVLIPADSRLSPTRATLPVMGALILISSFTLGWKYGLSLLTYAYSYLAAYLCLTAYIDKKTSEVYCVFNYAGFVTGTLFFLCRYATTSHHAAVLLTLLLVIVFLILAKALHLYGAGDGEIFLVIAIFMLAGCDGMDGMFYTFMIYFLSTALITVTHIGEIDRKKMRFKHPIPFAPSIFAATVIIILFM